MEFALEGGGTLYGNVVETAGKTAIEVAIPGEVIVGATDAGVASGLLYQSNLNANASKVDWDSLVSGSEGGSVTNPSAQIKGNSYDINKLQKTQPYTYPDSVSSIKETIVQNGPNSVPPIEIRIYHGKVLVVDGHHRLEAFRQLGYNRVPIKYLHSTQLGKTLPDGIYYRSIEELLDAAKISN